MRTKTFETLYIPSPRLNQLNIASELAENPHLTQAELARRCNLSVSMVNNYLKELCSMGWLEYHRKSSKTVSYHITPGGLQRLNEVRAEFIHEMVEIFAVAKERILAAVLKGAGRKPRRAAIFGTGHLAQLAGSALQSSGIEVVPGFEDGPDQVNAPDILVVALEYPWALDNLDRVLDQASRRGIGVVRLNGHFAQSLSKPSLSEEPSHRAAL